MDQGWTLHVERLGKVKKADIRISPLTFFIGDNNSGKSYLMSTLWGILFLGKSFFPAHATESRAYRRCEDWLQQNMKRDAEITDDIMQMYVDWYNELLSQNKRKFFQKLFNFPMDVGKISIEKYTRTDPIKIRWKETAERYSVTRTYFQFPCHGEMTRDEVLRINTYICWNLLMLGIAAPLFTPVIRGRRIGEPVYFPASRTGFMLTYSQLLDSSLQSNFSDMQDADKSRLTLPYIDFLQLVTKFESMEGTRNQDLVKFLEHEMASGSLKVKKEFLPNINYRPRNKDCDMPLHVTSSVITEIAPLLLLLKSNIDFKAIVIEEPEAHLHPALQRKMARFIIRLMHKNVMVMVTTHSDVIMQHVNNMLRLNGLQDRESRMREFQYDENDLLDGARATAFKKPPHLVYKNFSKYYM